MTRLSFVLMLLLLMPVSQQVHSDSSKTLSCDRSVISRNAANSLKLGKIVKAPEERSVWLGIYPGPIATDKQGDLFVVDQVNRRIVKYPKNGEPTVFAKFTKGTPITRDYIAAISSDGREGIYVVDSEANLLIHYDRDGSVVRTIDYAQANLMHIGSGEYRSNFQPDGISVDTKGRVFLYSIYDSKSGGIFDEKGIIVAKGVVSSALGASHRDFPTNTMVYYNGFYHAFGGPVLNILEIYNESGAVVSQCDISGIAPAYRGEGVITHMSKAGYVYLIDAYSLDIIRIDKWTRKNK